MNHILTDEERQRFAQWLEDEADSGEMIAVQMEKMNTPPTDMLAKRERTEAMAARIIAKKLRSIETQTVG